MTVVEGSAGEGEIIARPSIARISDCCLQRRLNISGDIGAAGNSRRRKHERVRQDDHAARRKIVPGSEIVVNDGARFRRCLLNDDWSTVGQAARRDHAQESSERKQPECRHKSFSRVFDVQSLSQSQERYSSSSSMCIPFSFNNSSSSVSSASSRSPGMISDSVTSPSSSSFCCKMSIHSSRFSSRACSVSSISSGKDACWVIRFALLYL